MKKLKLLLFVLLIFPVFVSASNYDTEVNKANNLLNKERFVNTYEKYLIHGSNIKFEYNKSTGNKVNSAFSKGGFISMDEFNLTKKNGVTYLFEGVEFWTLTTSGDSVYAITYDNINTAKNKSSNYNGRATEFIIPTVTIHGEGKLNNPWYFDPVYKVTAKVDSKYATIEGDNPQYVKGNCTKSDCTAKIKIVEKSGYQYITNDCDGIYDSTTKILSVNNLKRDTVCNVSFGKGVYVITLNKATPNKIYLKNGENYYSDFETTTIIRKIESVEAKTGHTFIGYFYNGNKIINGDKEPSPADDKKILYESVTGKYITKNVTLEPTWESNKYTITFDCNGGSNPPAAQTATYDSAFTLTSSVCQRAGYTQPKWNTKSDGTGEDYTVSVYTNYIWKKTSNVKLYAIWNECPAGTYSPANSNICTDCPVGSSCAKGSSEPTQCSAGTYTMTTGNATCSPCAAGSYNTGTGNTTCTQCSKGSYNTETGKTSCIPCQASGAAGTGGTTSAAGQTSCDTSCNKSHVSTWETSSWNTNNTLTNNCKIKTCLTGYTLGSNTCSANTYTINYAGMDSATHGSSHPTTATYDTAFIVNNPSKSGYTFTGWNISGMDSVTHTYGSNTTTSTSISKTKETSFKNLRSTSGTVTFTATWTINQYTLTIKPSGGKYNNSTSDTVITQNYNTTYTVANPSAGPTYTISYNMNGTGVTAPTSPTSVQRPFSSWTNSGSGTLNGTTYTFGAGDGTLTATYNTTSNSFSLPSINKTGYACKWAEGSTSGTQYAGGASRTITANKTYYAICNINAYALTINPNGGTWGGKTTNSTVTQNYNTTYTVAAPTAGPTYTISYNMNGTGVTAPTSPTSVQRPFSSWTNSGSGSLSGTTYTFGAGAGTLTATYNGTSNSFNLPAISKTGYTCKWAEGSASGTQYAGGSSRTITANTTYYAVCTINQYTLTVAPNGGTWNSSTSNQTFKQNYASTKTIANPTAGPTYTISYNANSQGATYTASPTSVQRPFTSWTRSGSGSISGTTYTYGPGDGTLTATYNSTSNSFTLPAISKTGHVCQWAKGSASGTKINGNTATTITGNTTFYASCIIQSYNLVVNPNGGTWSGSTASQTFTQEYNSTKTIAAPTANATYTISYNANSQGATYTSSPTSVARAFSGWTKSGSGTWNSSTNTFTFGNGTGTLTAAYNGTSASFTLPAISKTGYTCKWAQGSASGTQYAGGTSRTITANTTFYAVCTINQYTLTINPNGGTWGGKTTNSSVTQNYNTTYTVANPTAGATYTISYNANSQGATYTASPTSVQRPFSSWTKSGTGTLSGTTFTFGAGAGTLTAAYNGTSASFTLPTITKSGSICKWAQGSASGTQYAGGTARTITGNTTFYAVCTANTFTVALNTDWGSWLPSQFTCPNTNSGTTCTNSNGWSGKIDGNTIKKIEKTFTSGSFIDFSSVPVPSIGNNQGMALINEGNWWTQSYHGGSIIGANTPVTSNLNLHNRVVNRVIDVKLDANGGTLSDNSFFTYYDYGSVATDFPIYGKRSSLPTPTRSGYTFVGWYETKHGGRRATDNTTVFTPAEHTLYAQWQKSASCTLRFYDGSNNSYSSKTVNKNSTFGTLPQPTNYAGGCATLSGFYIKGSNGSLTQVTANTVCDGADYDIYVNYSVNSACIQAAQAAAQYQAALSHLGCSSSPESCMQANSEAYFGLVESGDWDKIHYIHDVVQPALCKLSASCDGYSSDGYWRKPNGDILYEVDADKFKDPNYGGSYAYVP